MKTRFAAVLLLTLLLGQGICVIGVAQQPGERAPRPRRLAPGVLTVIPPARDQSETFTGPLEFLEITKGIDPAVLNWKPNYSPESDTLRAKAASVVFRRPVWNLEFAFKPLRMIEIDMPQPSGKFVRTQVWYLVYRIRNPGYHLSPKEGHFEVVDAKPNWVEGADPFGHFEFGPSEVNHSVRFFPRFVLQSHEYEKKYLDQLVPIAIPQIQRREDAAIKLYDSVSISTVDIPVSDERVDRSVWGVATWVGLDPRMDFFSIYIQGLTNAYQFIDDPAKFDAKNPFASRKLSSKTLQLNFWRPGDEVLLTEKELRYGMPNFTDDGKEDEMLKIYGMERKMDYRWFFP
jgi:hypothetical protein